MKNEPTPRTDVDDPNYPMRVEHIYEFVISVRQKPERLDAFITKSIVNATRTRVQRAIDQGSVVVNNNATRSNYKVRPADVIRVTVMKPPPLTLIPQDIPLTILFEDEHLLVIDKPSGILAHPGLGNRSGTLVNAVLWHIGFREPIDVLKRREGWYDEEAENETKEEEPSEEIDGSDYEPWGVDDSSVFESKGMRPGIVHRLDKDTTGIMVIGKTYEATQGLAIQFADRTVSRQYVALAWGVVKDDSFLIESEIGRSPKDRKLRAVVERGGKYAGTEVTVLERYGCASLVMCKLKTGRTHQIRVHLSAKRHPLVGDADYGGRELAMNAVFHSFRRMAQIALSLIQRQALHAQSLGFTHPITKVRMTFESPIPPDMQACIDLFREGHTPHASANP